MYVLYVAKKDEPKTKAREETEIRPKFRVSCKELLSMPRVADKQVLKRSKLGWMKLYPARPGAGVGPMARYEVDLDDW